MNIPWYLQILAAAFVLEALVAMVPIPKLQTAGLTRENGTHYAG
jgi:hypothetical protein